MLHSRNAVGLAAVLSVAVASTVQSLASAQIPGGELAQQMSGASARKWVVTAVANWLGPGNRCKSGETYTFFADQTVRHDVCTSGALRETTLTWHVLPDANGENVIDINGTHYEVRFLEHQHIVEVRLRSIVVKGVQVNDIVLTYTKPEI
jgi:hypothetical protein